MIRAVLPANAGEASRSRKAVCVHHEPPRRREEKRKRAPSDTGRGQAVDLRGRDAIFPRDQMCASRAFHRKLGEARGAKLNQSAQLLYVAGPRAYASALLPTSRNLSCLARPRITRAAPTRFHRPARRDKDRASNQLLYCSPRDTPHHQNATAT